MKVCPNCGKEVKAGDRFCTGCGFNLLNQAETINTGSEPEKVKEEFPKALENAIVAAALVALVFVGLKIYSLSVGSGDIIYDIFHKSDSYDDYDSDSEDSLFSFFKKDDDDYDSYDDDYDSYDDDYDDESGERDSDEDESEERDSEDEDLKDSDDRKSDKKKSEDKDSEDEDSDRKTTDSEYDEASETEEAAETEVIADPVKEALDDMDVDYILSYIKDGSAVKLKKTDLEELAVYSACEMLAYKIENDDNGNVTDFYRTLDNIEDLEVVNNRENTFVFEKGAKVYYTDDGYALISGVIDHSSRGSIDERSGTFELLMKQDDTQPFGYLPVYSVFFYHEY